MIDIILHKSTPVDAIEYILILWDVMRYNKTCNNTERHVESCEIEEYDWLEFEGFFL